MEFHDNLVLAASLVVSLSSSAGYLIRMLRGGTLLSAFMASTPVRQVFDPLPVIESFPDANEDDDVETLASLVNVG